MSEETYPPGWDADRVRRVLEHYESQTEDEAVAEDEAAFADHPETVVSVPIDLMPQIRELISKHSARE